MKARTARHRFARALRDPDAPGFGDTVLVALSGGLDSCALLHLLRFAPGPDAQDPLFRGRLVAAHFDHRMRPGSSDDARWVRGLCRAWGVDLFEGTALATPRSEAEAREARYAFLREVAEQVGATRLATAHHADDQAETVLFRILRGTGPAGLAGIPTRGGVWRPLLSTWRDELLDYARSVGLGWREDPSNLRLDLARNALRHRILPDAERLVSDGARRALVRLAEVSAGEEAAWESLLPGLVAGLAPDRGDHGISLDRSGLVAMHRAVRARVLRSLLAELGLRPGARVTRSAVSFVEEAQSGRTLDLGGSVVLRRALDRIVLEERRTTPDAGPDEPLVIPAPSPGAGRATLSGRVVRVSWGREAGRPGGRVEGFAEPGLRFPLMVRGWRHGDRMRASAGTRKLKQVFLEARVPAPERGRMPVLADADGEVLWIPGVARSVRSRPSAAAGRATRTLFIAVG